MKVVVDTNVLVSALMSPEGSARQVLRMCFHGQLIPLIGNALFAEYEDVLNRNSLFAKCFVTFDERQELLSAFASICIWTPIFYLWRPNLRDEADNHVIELAVAGGAKAIITSNLRDFGPSELNFNDIVIQTPKSFLETKRPTQ